VDGAMSDRQVQGLLEVAAMDAEMASTIELKVVGNWNVKRHATGVPFARASGRGDAADVKQVLLDTQTPHDTHDMWVEIDPGSDATRAGRLLVDADVMACSLQQNRRSRATKSGANDGDDGTAAGDHFYVVTWRSGFVKALSKALGLTQDLGHFLPR
jgi:hypothetical protein